MPLRQNCDRYPARAEAPTVLCPGYIILVQRGDCALLFNRMKIETADLEMGMFVAQLDRPWLETPFLFRVSRSVTTEN